MTVPQFRLAPQEYDPAIPLDKISEHPDNANEGDDEIVSESIDINGFFGAVMVQRSTGWLLYGHTRYRQARAKGATHLPGFWFDGDDETARRILAVDNESTRRGKNDLAKLLALLKPIKDLRGSGFTVATVANLAALLGRQGAYGDEPTNPTDEWEGMPDFEQPDRPGAFVTSVHFPTQADADRFFALIDRPKATWLWWPESDGHQGTVSDEHGPLEVSAE